MQKIIGAMRRGITDYGMIDSGDKIAVGLSGGKDSILLLKGLSLLKKFIDTPFELAAITIDPQFNSEKTDFSGAENFCAENNIEYIIKRTDLAEIIFDIRKEKNPCSLCARMRRGMLHDTINAMGYNKLALGHHRDDAVETFLMNLTQEGRIGCFRPVTYLSRKNITMIRPMLYLNEREVISAVKRNELPVVQSACPVDKTTLREKTKNWISELEKTDHPGLSEKIIGALKNAGIDGW